MTPGTKCGDYYTSYFWIFLLRQEFSAISIAIFFIAKNKDFKDVSLADCCF